MGYIARKGKAVGDSEASVVYMNFLCGFTVSGSTGSWSGQGSGSTFKGRSSSGFSFRPVL